MNKNILNNRPLHPMVWLPERAQCADISHRTPTGCNLYSFLNKYHYVKLIALCETDAEEIKFCIRNKNGSLNRKMKKGYWAGGFTLSSGKPVNGHVYLMVDALLEGFAGDVKPDLIYSHKGETFESTIFGYEIEDAPGYFDL